jgi:hypothetical protein
MLPIEAGTTACDVDGDGVILISITRLSPQGEA